MKQAGKAILIFNKNRLQAKISERWWGRTFHTHQRKKNLPRWHLIFSIYVPKPKAPLVLISHTDSGNLQYLTLNNGQIIQTKTKQRNNGNIRHYRKDLIGTYRTFHPNTKEYIFFSAPHETLQIVTASLNRYKQTEVTFCILSDYYNRNPTNPWKLNIEQTTIE